jgi:hypothetical protein
MDTEPSKPSKGDDQLFGLGFMPIFRLDLAVQGVPETGLVAVQQPPRRLAACCSGRRRASFSGTPGLSLSIEVFETTTNRSQFFGSVTVLRLANASFE